MRYINHILFVAISLLWLGAVPLQTQEISIGKPGSTSKDCDDCPEMVLIPSGSFKMGSDNGDSDEKPVHRVNIDYDFYMGKYEVTQRQ